MLALGRDLSHDALNSDVADHLEDDLLLQSPVDSDSTIVSADLQNTLRFGEVQKVVAKGLFLQTRWAAPNLHMYAGCKLLWAKVDVMWSSSTRLTIARRG